MAVPGEYNTVGEYFEDVLEFLGAYHWVYCFPNTHVLVNKVFERFPVEWLPCLKQLENEEFNDLATGKAPIGAPDSLKLFLQKIKKLKPVIPKTETGGIDYKFPNNSGLSEKKKHEIAFFAPLIHKIYEESGSKCIVDVGTGLGYLPNLLFANYNYSTLGIEGSREKVRLARINQRKYPKAAASITYIEHFVTGESERFLKEIAEEKSITDACIIGLHACADLSVTVLELFTKLDFAKSLLIMPCCYHRLKRDGDGFEKFPASNLLKDWIEKTKTGQFLQVPFLRLACQGTGLGVMSEMERKAHTNSCLFRAVLQEVSETEKCQVRRLKRKSGKLNPSDPFEAYLSGLERTHGLSEGHVGDYEFKERMREKWISHKENAHLIEALAALQAALQEVCENVVLLDRVVFLTEQGVKCFVVRVTDRGISPRCHALIATKP